MSQHGRRPSPARKLENHAVAPLCHYAGGVEGCTPVKVTKWAGCASATSARSYARINTCKFINASPAVRLTSSMN